MEVMYPLEVAWLVSRKVLPKFTIWDHLIICVFLPTIYIIKNLFPYLLKAIGDFDSFHYFHKVIFSTDFPCQKVEPEIPNS